MNGLSETPQLKDKERLVRLAAFSTFFSLIPTAYAAYLSNSVTLLADLLRCIAEFLAIFLSWLVLRKIVSGGGKRFDYGYGKLEELSSLGVAAAMLVAFSGSLLSGFKRLWDPVLLHNPGFGLGLALLSVMGNSFLWRRNYLYTKTSASSLIDSQRRLFRSKAIISLVVVVSLTVSWRFSELAFARYMDPLGSFVIALFLLRSAYLIVSDSMSDLIDCSVEEALQLVILKMLIKHEHEYVGLHAIRSRRSGPAVYIDLLLEFDKQRKMESVQHAIDSIRVELEAQVPGSKVNVIPSSGAV